MFKMSTIRTHATSQSKAPLIHSSIHDDLIEFVPLLNEAFFQMSNFTYPGPDSTRSCSTLQTVFRLFNKKN